MSKERISYSSNTGNTIITGVNEGAATSIIKKFGGTKAGNILKIKGKLSSDDKSSIMRSLARYPPMTKEQKAERARQLREAKRDPNTPQFMVQYGRDSKAGLTKGKEQPAEVTNYLKSKRGDSTSVKYVKNYVNSRGKGIRNDAANLIVDRVKDTRSMDIVLDECIEKLKKRKFITYRIAEVALGRLKVSNTQRTELNPEDLRQKSEKAAQNRAKARAKRTTKSTTTVKQSSSRRRREDSSG